MRKVEQALGVTAVNIELPLWVNNINCFLFKGQDGWDLVDTGIFAPQTRERWRETFGRLRINPRDIKQIVITHDHVDHFGAAGYLQELTQAPVKMFYKENNLVCRRDWLREILQGDNVFHYFGLSQELKDEVIKEKIKQFQSWAPSIPEIEDINNQETIVLGSKQYEILKFSGHCAEQICFYEPDTAVLLAGDVLVTPNHLNAYGGNPLAEYFNTLQLLQKFKIACLIPSHGKPFTRVDIRIGLIAEYRKQQLQELKEHLAQEPTVYEAYRFFVNRGALADLFFGLTEVFFFLEYLVEIGEAERRTRRNSLYYRKV